MRESVGSTWIFESIIFFILIFAAFLSLVIQYSRAYIVKNEVLTILEKYEGASISKELIGNYLEEQGYKTKGSCPTGDGWYGAIDYDNLKASNSKEKYYYCIQESTKNHRVYYNVVFFYKFNLPILGELNTYRVVGETKSFVGADNRLLS